MPKITGIMACTKEGVIGLNGRLPWNYSQEFEYFQEQTNGHCVIMGRKTFDEMQKTSLLKNRQGIVFTRNLDLAKNIDRRLNVKFVNSFADFLEISLPQDKKIFVIGGAEIAELFLKNGMIEEFSLTTIHKNYKGDKFFPLKLIKDWMLEQIYANKDFTINKLKRL